MTAPPPSLAVSALGDWAQAAMDIGRSKRLQSSDGTWFCWGCGTETAFHVSLHCDWCLAQHLERKARQDAKLAAQSPEDSRWRAMTASIRYDTRLDRDAAVKLLAAARELPSMTADRMQDLNRSFDKRFDAAAPTANWGTFLEHTADEAYR
jgi:hypothetical protein